MREFDDVAKRNGAVNLSLKCPLCDGNAELFFEMPGKEYYQCGQCSGLFLGRACYVSKEDEKRRYEKHNNNIEDPRYQKFVEPIVSKIQETFGREHQGLDFGAGTGPVIAKLLREKGYSVELYDPYFCDDPKTLEKEYDFIVCCEVIEHFHYPAKEFRRLRSLLKPGGVLFCQTALYSKETDFKNWYYKNDQTHVFFYHANTLLWIQSKCGFSALETYGRLALFSI
jgi:SAM-dependent methyltransferase